MPRFRPPPLELTLTVQEVAAHFAVSVRTIWRWIREGRIPPPLVITKRIRRWRFSDIEPLLNQFKRRP